MLQWFLERQAGNGAAVLVPKLMPNRWPPFFCLPQFNHRYQRIHEMVVNFRGGWVCWLRRLLAECILGTAEARGKVVHSNRHLLQLLPRLLIYVHVKLL